MELPRHLSLCLCSWLGEDGFLSDMKYVVLIERVVLLCSMYLVVEQLENLCPTLVRYLSLFDLGLHV